MPLRCLEYYVHLLYGIVPAKARYRETLFKIPTPEFYVFYNGNRKQNQERERTMRLSDAFIEPQADTMCEVKVKFSNIGGTDGKKLRVIQNCAIMKEYCEFIEIVARHRAALGANPSDSELLNCYENAINETIGKGILADYLSRKATEVRNMFFGEYDYDLDMQVKAEEAAERKAIEDALVAIKEFGASPEVAAEKMGAPLDLVLEALKAPIATA